MILKQLCDLSYFDEVIDSWLICCSAFQGVCYFRIIDISSKLFDFGLTSNSSAFFFGYSNNLILLVQSTLILIFCGIVAADISTAFT